MTTIEITKVTTAVTPITTTKAKTYRKPKTFKGARAKPAAPKTTAVAKSRGVSASFTTEDVAKKLGEFKTVTQLAKELKVTKPTAANYVHRLQKARKVETKDMRQGKRGPLAIAYRVA